VTFPPIRTLGATLLASAGLAGLAVGLAARPILENLVAGVQIALTQPIRMDDVVIVETEYGRIEKITATYVVVRLWDLRRMVLPLTYFIDHPFQNWTYNTANLIGSVFLYLDYSISIEMLRDELDRILATTPLFDGKVKNVALTDAKDNGTVEIRVLVSARNSSELFDLRCLVREKLLAHVRDTDGGMLPSTRVQLAADGEPRDARENGRASQAAPSGHSRASMLPN
jgi:small-conductance mechanosensitive channel